MRVTIFIYIRPRPAINSGMHADLINLAKNTFEDVHLCLSSSILSCSVSQPRRWRRQRVEVQAQ